MKFYWVITESGVKVRFLHKEDAVETAEAYRKDGCKDVIVVYGRLVMEFL